MLLVSFVTGFLVLTSVQGLSPVILIPGLAGSVLEGKFNRPSVPYWDCEKQADWHVVYLNIWEAVRPNCLINELAIFYDNSTGEYSNQPGIEIRAHDFGGINGVIAIDPSEQWFTQLFYKIAQDLQSKGYEVRKSLFGAPYDFRLASQGLEQVGYYKDLKQLIENAVESNRESATIISHSMGCQVIQYFLQTVGEDWLKRNLKDYIAISCPWQGAVPMLKASISGDNFDLPIPNGLLHPLQSSAPSGDWLLPRPAAWGPDEVLVQTNGGAKYTAQNMKTLLTDLGSQQAAMLYDSVVGEVSDITLSQSVRLTCIYGEGVNTEAQYVYEVSEFVKDVTPGAPKVSKYTDGDGTVNKRSLTAQKCASSLALNGERHVGILESDYCIQKISAVLGLEQIAEQ